MRTRTARSIRKDEISLDQFIDRSFFEVLETDAFFYDVYGNLERAKDKKVLMKTDGSYISTVGKNYSIVDNKRYFDSIIESLAEAKVEYKPIQAYQEGNGRRTTMIVQLPQFDLYPNTTEHQKFELRIVNSFDTTKAADTILGFLRLVCTNGMTAFDADFSYRMIHKGDIIHKAEQAIELYRNFESVWERNKATIENMGNAYGRKDSVAKYIGDGETSLNQMLSGPRWAKKLLVTWQQNNETTNLWEIYNIFTEIFSHNYGAEYTSKLNKMNELNKQAKNWNRIFDVSTIEEAQWIS